jgi:uncharacterized membrane protein
VAAVAAAVVALAAAPPLVPPGPRGLLMALFDPACHQLPARSFAVGGVPFALCQRCTGIVAGLALGALFAPLALRRAGRWGLPALAVAALPPLADWGLGVLGVWANTPASRALTGLAFGLAAGVALVEAAASGAAASGAAAGARAEPAAERAPA